MQHDVWFRTGVNTLMLTLTLCVASTNARAQDRQATDPRIGLSAGWKDAGSAISNLELVGSVDRPEGFFNPESLGDLLLANSDMAFRGGTLFLGSFHGFNIYDIARASAPVLHTSFVCPGGQGDLSVHGNLLFMSVEMPNARVDCGTTGTFDEAPSAERFRGVRIFDISDLSRPRQVAAVQTCRGSHTHTLVTDPDDDQNVYIYVSGTSTVRPAAELEGCSGLPPEEDPNTSYFRIEVIRVPVAAPQQARIINAPRIFADAETGEIVGLWRGGAHGPGTQTTATTNQCHDITAYPAIGLAAGACSGNGILLDISDAANPVRIAEVIDPNFAYWHSATFNNTGTKVIFTDEWGG
ncbi:MAG: LVIVD repeat-containing protein, partial [Longimicrobiales bacterium]